MAIKIDRKITGYEVVKEEASAQKGGAGDSNVVHMHEKLERPETLVGNTYKIKTPLTEHALYVTINDIILNPGTPHEKRRPFEIFINSKSMDHFQWIVALTRIISAVFRKGGGRDFSGRGASQRIRSPRRILQKGQVHPVSGSRNRGRHRMPHENDRHDPR